MNLKICEGSLESTAMAMTGHLELLKWFLWVEHLAGKRLSLGYVNKDLHMNMHFRVKLIVLSVQALHRTGVPPPPQQSRKILLKGTNFKIPAIDECWIDLIWHFHFQKVKLRYRSWCGCQAQSLADRWPGKETCWFHHSSHILLILNILLNRSLTPLLCGRYSYIFISCLLTLYFIYFLLHTLRS